MVEQVGVCHPEYENFFGDENLFLSGKQDRKFTDCTAPLALDQ